MINIETVYILIGIFSTLSFLAGFLIGFVKVERHPEQMKKVEEEKKNKNFLSELLNNYNDYNGTK